MSIAPEGRRCSQHPNDLSWSGLAKQRSSKLNIQLNIFFIFYYSATFANPAVLPDAIGGDPFGLGLSFGVGVGVASKETLIRLSLSEVRDFASPGDKCSIIPGENEGQKRFNLEITHRPLDLEDEIESCRRKFRHLSLSQTTSVGDRREASVLFSQGLCRLSLPNINTVGLPHNQLCKFYNKSQLKINRLSIYQQLKLKLQELLWFNLSFDWEPWSFSRWRRLAPSFWSGKEEAFLEMLGLSSCKRWQESRRRKTHLRRRRFRLGRKGQRFGLFRTRPGWDFLETLLRTVETEKLLSLSPRKTLPRPWCLQVDKILQI